MTKQVKQKTKKIGILGTGTWGIALGRILAKTGHKVVMWSAILSELQILTQTHRHPNLPDMEVPDSIIFTQNIGDACQADVVIFAVPSVYIRSTAKAASPFIGDQILVDVAKGVEPDTLMTMSEIIRQETGSNKVVVLSGPTHAEEVAHDMPTTIVSACESEDNARIVQDLFMTTCMRVYTNTDVRGVELCGAAKNVVALASGICTGLGYGDNARAALITRGMAQITRLGRAMGCSVQTFNGLAGMGDLIVTATSSHSRNNRCGTMIGQGMAVKDAVSQVGMVVEGIHAIPAMMSLSQKYVVQLPIISAVDAVVNHESDPAETVKSLMKRDLKSQTELDYESALLKHGRRNGMKRVITYGTFDLLHYGHINLLRRAKALGDYLVVVISTDEFNWNEKQKKSYFTYEQRKSLVQAVRYVDLVIPETSWEQKKTDVHEYHIDTFVMGDDWKGKFDFLRDEGVQVVYLPRTPQISTTQIKNDLNKI